jgi:hypothetical protein
MPGAAILVRERLARGKGDLNAFCQCFRSLEDGRRWGVLVILVFGPQCRRRQ